MSDYGQWFRQHKVLMLLGISFCFGWALGVAEASPDQNLSKEGIALKGYDPVSYFSASGPAAGLEEHALDFGGARYLFASEDNKKAFLAKPEDFQPAFGGWCAWAMLEGDRVEVNPEAYRIYDGKLLLFYDGFWGDTKAKWIRKAKKEGESSLFQQALRKWTSDD